MSKQLNAAAVAAKWASRTQGATDAMKAGVQAVTENPAQKAAASKDKWLANIQAAAAAGKFEAGLAKVTLQSWQQKMLSKGVANVAAGVRDATADVQSFFQQFLPYAQQVSDQIKQMPSATKEDNRQRMLANFDAMSNFKRS